jgi:hypothetical protein
MLKRERETVDLDEIGGSLRDYFNDTVRAPLPSRMQVLLTELLSVPDTGTAVVDPQRSNIETQPRDLAEPAARAPKLYGVGRAVSHRSRVKRWLLGR